MARSLQRHDPVIDLAGEQAEGKPMMPLLCAHIRSIARCVLPVLVGPRTAVTAPDTRLVIHPTSGFAGAVATAWSKIVVHWRDSARSGHVLPQHRGGGTQQL
ncbi:hypothetical protein GCM10020258_18270 [Sphingomonas yabuuchiae]